MHQAGKMVLTALFAVITLFALSQPSSRAFAAEEKREATASQLRQGQSFAMTDKCLASDYPLTGVASYLPKPYIVAYSANAVLLSDLRSVKYTLIPRKDITQYAEPKLVTTQETATPEASVNEPISGEVKTEAIEAESLSLNADVLFNLVNQHREKIGLSVLQKDDGLMQVASARAPELFDEIFVNGNMHAGFYARNLPYYATENIIYNQSESGALSWWLGSSVHRAAIENSSHTHAGIACSGRTCSMVYTHFQPR